MPYLKINYDDALPPFEEVELPENPTEWLRSCYDAIGCTTIQTVPTIFNGLFKVVLIVDDEAKLYDGWERRINKIATQLYGSEDDVIVGDVLLARVEGYDLVPLAYCEIDFVKRGFGYA